MITHAKCLSVVAELHACMHERSRITVTMPRASQRQQHRPNPESGSVEDYFKFTTISFSVI